MRVCIYILYIYLKERIYIQYNSKALELLILKCFERVEIFRFFAFTDVTYIYIYVYF